MKTPRNFPNVRILIRAFTLVELLVVIVILSILFTLGLMALNRARSSAAEAKSILNLKSVTQASLSFAMDNNGIIPALRWQGDPALALMPRTGYILSSFWASVQPYLLPGITVPPANNSTYADAIKLELVRLFGVNSETFIGGAYHPRMKGSPFQGVSVPADWSGIRNPIGFNVNVARYNELARLQNVDSVPGTIYAAYGWGTFSETSGMAYVPMRTDGSPPDGNARINFLPSKRAIVSFLDGRVEYLAAPIPENMFTTSAN